MGEVFELGDGERELSADLGVAHNTRIGEVKKRGGMKGGM